jgi:CheY-like chemotaxis protein
MEAVISPSRIHSEVQLRTVLLADDSRTVRHVLAGVFEAIGFDRCIEAKDGAEALKQAAEVQPNLIVLDLSMPTMNGLDAARALKRVHPTTPIILFTMYPDGVSAEDAKAAGISSVVPKPDVNRLVSETKACLRSQ